MTRRYKVKVDAVAEIDLVFKQAYLQTCTYFNIFINAKVKVRYIEANRRL